MGQREESRVSRLEPMPTLPSGTSDAVLKAHRARVLTADNPAAVRRHLADAYADFASRAHRGESDWACPQKTRHAPWGSERKAA
jgi:hypothetical protein